MIIICGKERRRKDRDDRVILCGIALLCLMRICDRARWVMLCMCVFQGCICNSTASNTTLNSSIVMLKWMCRRLIRERMRESMSECEIMCLKLCVCVCLCLKWVMNCHLFEWKAIHHPHHWLWGPVITYFPSFTLLMTISFDQPLCYALKQSWTFDYHSSVETFIVTDYVFFTFFPLECRGVQSADFRWWSVLKQPHSLDR